MAQRLLALAALCAAGLTACSNPPPAGSANSTLPADTAAFAPDGGAKLDAKSDAAAPDAITAATDADTAETAADSAAQPADADATGEVAATCPGAPGCSCDAADNCSNGLCLDYPEGKRCATPCGQGCPDGKACAALPGKGGQNFEVCVPKWGKLCYPCAATKDCEIPGVAGALCTDQGKNGLFCGAPCKGMQDCPNGYACLVADSPEGPKAPQCVRVAADGKTMATCSCTQAAKSLALATPCYYEQKNSAGTVVGKCPGTRTCGPTGLGACVKVGAKAEVCDGVDNDCNGQVDDNAGGCGSGETCVDGKCQGACKAVDGGWGPWQAGECSAKCGGGTLKSTRTCSNPAPVCGGKACDGPAEKSEPCNPGACSGSELPKGVSVFATAGQIFKGNVPAGVSKIELWAWGGGGGGGFPGSGGGGGFVHANVTVAAGDAMELRVAEGGDIAGGGGASYLYRNGKVVAVAGGGGGAGLDGCSGCEGGAAAGAGGGGGAVGQDGAAGADNNAYSTNSGGGKGGTQSAGGAGGKQANASAYTGCTQNGAAGAANAGGAGIGGYMCNAPSDKCTAAFEKAGVNCPGNGGSGGGGSGYFGGGSGAAMYTYSGGGGGGGSSWLAPEAAVVSSEAGSGASPGGKTDANWAGNAGSGGGGVQGAFKGNPTGGMPGLVVISL